MATLHFSKDGFERARDSGALMMVDFWASWCGPCKIAAPIVERIAEGYEGRAIVGKVNTDDEQALAMEYEITGIPTVLFFKDGKEIDRKVGVVSAESYSEVLDACL